MIHLNPKNNLYEQVFGLPNTPTQARKQSY